MEEIKNYGQFDDFVREIINNISRIKERITEGKYNPKGMDKVLDALIDANFYAYLCLSDDAEENGE